MARRREARLRALDAAEALALFAVPALLVGVAVSALAGGENFVGGLFVGGLFGGILAGLRRGFRAVRTGDGVERRLREPDEDNPWIRLAAVDYDERYDRYLAVVLALVGVGAFAAIPVFGVRDAATGVRLAALGLFGLVAALAAYGLLRS